jgi:hypothetical protein
VKAKGVRAMNKYFSKALFYVERRERLFALAANIFLCGSCFMNFSFTLAAYANNRIEYYNDPFTIVQGLYGWFIFFAIAAVIASYNQKDKKYYYLLTQPYSRDSIIITKTISYAVSYTIPVVVYGIACFILMTVNKSSLGDNYSFFCSQLFLVLFGLIAALTLITTIIQLMQILFGKTFSAILIPVFMYNMLFLHFEIAKNFITNRLIFLRDFYSYAASFLRGHNEIIIGDITYKSLTDITSSYFYKPTPFYSLIVILFSIVIVVITVALNRRIKAENTAEVFMFSFSEKIFRVILSMVLTVFSTLFIAMIIYYLISLIIGTNVSTYFISKYGLKEKELIEHNIYLFINVLWIPMYMLVYKILGKPMNKRRDV